MATPAQRTNTWILNEWYDQAVAGTQGAYVGQQQLFMAGRNNQGQLGQNNKTTRSSPVQVGSSSIWKTVCVPSDFRGVHATKTDGTLWWWGATDNGSSGTNQKTTRSSPIQITGTTWNSLAAATNSSICTKTDGSLWVWGYGRYGQLANNDSGPSSSKNRSSPIQVGTETTWSSNVFSGYQAHGGIKTDGTMWFWGQNANGVFGTNDRTERSSPTQLPGTWSTTEGHFAFSYTTTLAIKNDGSLWAWGNNDYGQLGQGQPDNNHRSSPVQVPGTNWSYVASGISNMLAVKTNGELYSWGWGDYGYNGQNNRTEYKSPEKIGTGTDWSKVFAGHESSLGGAAAIKADGSLYVWGRNEYGQAGRNDTVSFISSPTQIPGTWKMASPNNESAGYVSEL